MSRDIDGVVGGGWWVRGDTSSIRKGLNVDVWCIIPVEPTPIRVFHPSERRKLQAFSFTYEVILHTDGPGGGW
jgi:hypothetical protein